MRNLRWIFIRLAALVIVCLLPILGFGQDMDPAARGKVMDAIEAKYAALSKVPITQRREQVVGFMKTFPSITKATVSEDGNMCCVFKDDTPYMIIGNVVPNRDKLPVGLPGTDHLGGGSSDPAPAPRDADWWNPPPAPAVPRPDPFACFSALQFQGNDLPEVPKARICNCLGKLFGNGHERIRALLTSKGYQVEPGYDASIATLKNLGTPGVFYYGGHGGIGYAWDKTKKVFDKDYIIVTGEEWSAAKETAFRAQAMMFNGFMGECGAIYDNDSQNKPIHKRFFYITKAFIKKYWKFSKNSFVAMDTCTSWQLLDVMKDPAVNASVFCGFNGLSTNPSTDGIVFLVDRMLGANDPGVKPEEPGWPQRPFDYNDLDTDMKRKGLFPTSFIDEEGHLGKNSLLFAPCRDDFGLLAPSIKNITPIAYQRKCELNGMFGVDPGQGDRSVKLNNVAMVVDKWEPTKITFFLPNSENDSHGEVQVISRGRPSNSRWLSNWKGVVTVRITGEQTLEQNAEFQLNLIGDPWNYREHAGEKPVYPFSWILMSSIGSTCTWLAKGEEKDDRGVHYKWSGGGAPPPWLDENVGAKHTFGVGAVGDSFQKKVNFVMMINESFAFTESGTTNANTSVRLGDWSQGQSMFQAGHDQDFGIFGNTMTIDDEPSRVAYGGKNGKLTWTSMQCRYPMPKNAPR